MKVVFTSVGDVERPLNLEVDLPCVPREGETVNAWPEVDPANRIVRTVVWNVGPEDEDGDPIDEPFVYVVVGAGR